MAKEKSWKRQAEELSRESQKWFRKTAQLTDEINAYLKRFSERTRAARRNWGTEPRKRSPRGSSKNPASFEKLVLNAFAELRENDRLLIERIGVIVHWLSKFEWASQRRWWIGMFATLLVTVLAAIILG